MATTRLYAPRPYDEFDSGVAGVAPILSTGTDVDNTKVTAVQAAATASGIGTLPTSAGGTSPAPVAEPLRFRGPWQISTVYSYGDVVSQGGSLYVAPSAFTSGSSFVAGNWTKLGPYDATDPSFSATYVALAAAAQQTVTAGLNVGYDPTIKGALRLDDGRAQGNPQNSGPNNTGSIAGLFLNQNWQYRPALAAGATQSMVYLDVGNTDATRADSLLYGIQITTSTDRIDNGAGIAITNTGSADNLYLSVAGKSGTPAGDNAPTGIGIDVNRQVGGTVENATNNGGFGIQVWDYSTTNQGLAGPEMIKILKQGNPDSDHPMMLLRGNRRAIRIEQPRGGGFDGTQPLITVCDGDAKQNIAGLSYFAVTASGATTIQPRADVTPLLLKSNDPAGAQNAAILSVQDSNAALQLQITTGGNIWANRFRTLGSELQIDVQASGACIRMTKATAAAGNPGAGQARLYFRDGTNANTLKLVVRAGAAGAETTVLDNIPT